MNYLQVHLDDIVSKITLLNNVKKELKEQIQSTQSRLVQLKEKGRKNGGSKN